MRRLAFQSFNYSGLRTSSPALASDGALVVSVDVKNTGKRAGEEVVQLYVKHLNSPGKRPIQELRGFKRVALLPGEQKTIEFPLSAKSLALWNEAEHAFVVEDGKKIQPHAGASSADIRLKKILKIE